MVQDGRETSLREQDAADMLYHFIYFFRVLGARLWPLRCEPIGQKGKKRSGIEDSKEQDGREQKAKSEGGWRIIVNKRGRRETKSRRRHMESQAERNHERRATESVDAVGDCSSA